MAAAVLIPLIAHAGILGHDLLNWDDPECITQNPAVQRPDLGAIWAGRTPQAYPLTFSLFALEWRLWRDSPLGFHAVSLGLHALNALLVLALLRARGSRPVSALAAALFFGLHPIQVATVAWASEQKTLLASAFALLSWRLVVAAPLTPGRTLGALGCHLLALLAKTQVLLWPFGAIASFASFAPFTVRARAIYGGGAFVLGLLSAWVTMQRERAPAFEGGLDLIERLWVVGRSFAFSLSKTLLPRELSGLYPRWTVDPTQLSTWTPSLLGLALLLAGAVVTVRSRKWRLPFLAFTLPWLPASGLIPFGYQEKSFVADHLLYLSLLGPAIGLATLLDRPSARRRGVLALVAIGLAALALLTLWRLPTYRDSIAFWESVLRTNPTAWVARNNLGVAYAQNDQPEAAQRHLEEAVRLRPAYLEARINLADVYARTGRRGQAVNELREALRAQPGHPEARARLAALGDSTAASAEMRVARFERAVRERPRDFGARLELGRALVDAGRAASAIGVYREALPLASTQVESLRAWQSLGFALSAERRLGEALEADAAVLRLAPRDPIALMNVGVSLRALGRFDEAIERLEAAQRLAPDDAKIAANLEKARRRIR